MIKSNSKQIHVLILSPIPVWPVKNGYAMAIDSDISSLQSIGAKVTVIAFSDIKKIKDRNIANSDIPLSIIPWSRGGRVIRFLRSFSKKIPAVWERWYNRNANDYIESFVSCNDIDVVIIEDLPLSAYVSIFNKNGIKTLLRLHNIHSEMMDGLNKGSFLEKIFTLFESQRVYDFEQRAMAHTTNLCCISERDSILLSEIHGCKPPPVLSINLNRHDLLSIDYNAGNPEILIHIGVIDLRKKPGVERMIEGFKQLRKDNTHNYRLEFGGNKSINVKGLPAEGIKEHGRIPNDHDLFKKGRFFVNPQNVSGGIKLKSICALLAGRTLISTEEGVEGLDLVPNIHFILMRDPVELSKIIPDLVKNEHVAIEIAKNGREAVKRMFSKELVVSQLSNILDEVI